MLQRIPGKLAFLSGRLFGFPTPSLAPGRKYASLGSASPMAPNVMQDRLHQPKVRDWEDVLEASSAPANPPSGTLRLYTKTDDTLHTLNSAGVDTTLGSATPQPGFRNLLINGDMRVVQRGTSFASINNATYALDRWKVFSGASAANANAVVTVAQDTAQAQSQELYDLSLTVVDNTKKFGICQFITQQNINGVLGKTVTLSFAAKVSSAAAGHITNVKAAILSWTGTANSPTQPIAAANWNASGTTPGVATSWVMNNTPANLNVTTSWATYSVSAAILSTATNVAIFIWSDAFNTTVNDVLYLSDIQLEIASAATPFERRPYDYEIFQARRYFFKFTGAGNSFMGSNFNFSAYANGAVMGWVFPFPNVMIQTPTITYSTSATSYSSCSGLTFDSPGINGCRMIATANAANINCNFAIGSTDFVQGDADL